MQRQGASGSSTLNDKAQSPVLYGTIRALPDAANVESIEALPTANPTHNAHESKSSTSTKFPSSDEAGRRDGVNFALEMERSAQKALELGNARTESLPKRDDSVPLPQPVTREKDSEMQSQMDPVLSGAKTSSKRSSAMGSPAGKLDNGVGGYRYPSFKKLLRKQKTKAVEDLSSTLASAAPAVFPKRPKLERASSNESFSPTNSKVSHGCVEKHRLYMQRRSIAGYEEEVALMEATNAMRNALSQYAQDQGKHVLGQ